MTSYNLIKSYLIQNRLQIVAGMLALMVVDFLQLFIPRFVKYAIDDIATLRIEPAKLFSYLLSIAGLSILILLFRFIWRHFLIGASRRIEEALRNRLFGHIQTLSASYFDQVKTGDLMAHATNDIRNIQMATGMGLVAMTDAIVLGTATIGFMLYINVKLTLFAIIPAPLIVITTRFFSKKMHRRYLNVQTTFADMTETVRERFAGIRIIKAFNKEKEAAAKLEKISTDYIGTNLRLASITGAFFPLMLFFTNISLAIVLFLGGHQTITTVITPGDFIAFISYLGLLTWPMMAMGWVANLIQRGRASMDRINAILLTLPEIRDLPEAASISEIKDGISFENVSFLYRAGLVESGKINRKQALSDINIRIGCGETLGIVGPPGSGKSTIASLIPRLYDVTQGRILMDGIDIRHLKTEELKSLISFMPQEPFLFATSIKDNITFGNTAIREEELIQTVKAASLYELMEIFPDGFDTIVGEKGVILSGGQKQRVALARSLLSRAPVLILDDPVSQVDTQTGAAMIETIKSLAGKKTVIIISHRLSAVKHADQIIVVEDGRITESGSHDTLMKAGAYYARSFQLQELEEEMNAT